MAVGRHWEETSERGWDRAAQSCTHRPNSCLHQCCGDRRWGTQTSAARPAAGRTGRAACAADPCPVPAGRAAPRPGSPPAGPPPRNPAPGRSTGPAAGGSARAERRSRRRAPRGPPARSGRPGRADGPGGAPPVSAGGPRPRRALVAIRTAAACSHPASEPGRVSRPAERARSRKVAWKASSAPASPRMCRQARRTSGPLRRTSSAKAASSRRLHQRGGVRCRAETDHRSGRRPEPGGEGARRWARVEPPMRSVLPEDCPPRIRFGADSGKRPSRSGQSGLWTRRSLNRNSARSRLAQLALRHHTTQAIPPRFSFRT